MLHFVKSMETVCQLFQCYDWECRHKKFAVGVVGVFEFVTGIKAV